MCKLCTVKYLLDILSLNKFDRLTNIVWDNLQIFDQNSSLDYIILIIGALTSDMRQQSLSRLNLIIILIIIKGGQTTAYNN